MQAQVRRDIFVSHESEFKPWVEWLALALQQQGRSVFLDRWHLVPGRPWLESLHEAVQNCKSALLVATPETVNSGWVREEFAALQRRRHSEPSFRIVPLVFGSLPNLPFLSNLQCVDCRNPADYRRWFHAVLCGLDDVEPGNEVPEFPGLQPPPSQEWPARNAATAPAEQRFVAQVLRQLLRAACPPVIVLSQRHRHQGAVIRQLREGACSQFGLSAVVHVVPPFSVNAAVADCFIEFGRQCRLPDPTPDAIRFVAAIERRLAESPGTLMLLISGFENAAPAFREDLAMALRSLSEKCADTLRIVIVGGHRLAEQRNGRGESSFLSSARVEEWPHPTVSDVLCWQTSEYPEVSRLSESDAHEILAATGGNAALVQHLLARWAQRPERGHWLQWTLDCPQLWENWSRLLREVDRAELGDALQRDSFGPAIPWPPDPVARTLYWADMLGPDGNQSLVWRCAAVREVGRQVLA